MDGPKVPPRSAATELAGLLDSPEIGRLIVELDETRWTGRPGYPLRAMVGVALAKSLYSIPTWTRTVALVREHDALREAIGGECPSVYAAYRFAAKLRGTSRRTDPSASATPTRTRAGATARRSRRAREAASTATRSTRLSAPARTCPSRGRSRHPRARIVLCHCAARRGEGSRLCRRDDRARHGLRHRSDPRRLRGPRLSADHPAQADSRRQGREGEPAELRARDVDLRGLRSLARQVQVALPDRRLRAGGSRPTACIPSCRASRSGGSRSTEAVAPSSGSSAG